VKEGVGMGRGLVAAASTLVAQKAGNSIETERMREEIVYYNGGKLEEN
jgi:hypothetical protein